MKGSLVVAFITYSFLSFGQFVVSPGTTNSNTIYTNGSVGIGTTTPYGNLHIRNSDDGADQYSGIRFYPAKSSAQATIATQNYHVITGFRRNGLWVAGSSDGNSYSKSNILFKEEGLLLATSDGYVNPETNVKLFVANGGNIGIGTTSPANKLDISTTGDFQGIHFTHSSGRWTRFYSSLSSGSYNTITGQNDAGIIFGNTSGINTVANGFVIAPHLGGDAAGLRVDQNGNVGIGTRTPQNKLDITAGNSQGLQLYHASGRWTRFYTSLPSGSFNAITGQNDTGIIFGNDSGINTVTNGFVIAPYQGGNASGLRVDQNGNVGIGTSAPDAKLAVAGQIHATEVKVTTTVPGPDYVFEKDYALRSIESVKTYIDQNKHLPEVPSAKEMEVNGINLSEMNMLLLKKVEELTLYVIEQNKNLSTQQSEIQELKKEIKSLKNKQ